jgi:hypothetical protein
MSFCIIATYSLEKFRGPLIKFSFLGYIIFSFLRRKFIDDFIFDDTIFDSERLKTTIHKKYRVRERVVFTFFIFLFILVFVVTLLKIVFCFHTLWSIYNLIIIFRIKKNEIPLWIKYTSSIQTSFFLFSTFSSPTLSLYICAYY